MNHYEEMRYHEREHARYMAEHRHDVVSLAEEISCAQGIERREREAAAQAAQEPTPTTAPPPSADEQ